LDNVLYSRYLYQNTPSAPQCVSKIRDSILANGWKVVPLTPKTKVSEKKRAQLEWTLLQMGLNDILSFMINTFHIYGDSFIYAPRGSGSKSNIAVELHELENQALEVKIDKEARDNSGIIKPAGYRYRLNRMKAEYRPMTNRCIMYDTDDVIHFKRSNLVNQVYGESYLEDERATLTLGIRILNHNLNFFSNSAKPPMVIRLSDEAGRKEAQAFKRYLEKYYKGANKAWETMVTYGGTDITELSLPDTTAFFDMLTYVRIQVCGLYSVPPSEVGVTDKSGLNNTETLHKDFIKTNVNAKKKALGDFLTLELLYKRMGIDNMRILLPAMDSMSEKQRSETNAIRLFNGQATINDLNKEAGKEKLDKPYADELLIGNPKAIKGVYLLDDFLNDVTPIDAIGGTGGSNPQDKPEVKPNSSGRGDLDGRDKEPKSSINNED
jgi:HK97 family phage portal protein